MICSPSYALFLFPYWCRQNSEMAPPRCPLSFLAYLTCPSVEVPSFWLWARPVIQQVTWYGKGEGVSPSYLRSQVIDFWINEKGDCPGRAWLYQLKALPEQTEMGLHSPRRSRQPMKGVPLGTEGLSTTTARNRISAKIWRSLEESPESLFWSPLMPRWHSYKTQRRGLS